MKYIFVVIEIMENPECNNESGLNSKQTSIKLDFANLPSGPSLRTKVSN